MGYTYQAFKSKSSQISRSLLKLKEQNQSLLCTTLLSTCLAEPSSSTANASNALSELTAHLALLYLSYQSIDLTEIEAKLDQSAYQSLGEFLGDCLSFKHMIEVTVVAGIESDLSRRRIRDTLNRMLDACRYDLKEMLICVDCYRNSNRCNEDRYWFCQPCDPPHMLVFARQKGYPYWPAKVINPRSVADSKSCTEYDVRFFGAQHERFITDQSNIKDINSSLSELCITKANSSLEKALAELRIHRELLEKFEKGIVDEFDANEHVDGHKVIKRKYIRRQSVTSRKRSDSNSSGDSSSKRKGKSDDVKNVKTKKSRISRTNTVESDATAEPVDSDLDRKSAHVTESDRESEDVFEDAKEEMSDKNEVDAGEDDASTDVDESMHHNDDNEDVNEDSSTTSPQMKVEPTSEDDNEEDNDQQQHPSKGEVVSFKRGRGRPRKNFPSPTRHKSNANAETPTKPNGRIRRSKVLYSPQTYRTNRPSVHIPDEIPSPPTESPIPPPVRVSKRGRKPKSFFLEQSSTPIVQSSSPHTIERIRGSGKVGRGRGRGRGRALSSVHLSSTVKSPMKSPVGSPKASSISSTSRVSRKLSLSPSPVRSSNKKERTEKSSLRRKQNSERQRDLVQARRKFKLKRQLAQKASIVPRHIPPVTATKSSPALSCSALSKSISISPTTVPQLQKVKKVIEFIFD